MDRLAGNPVINAHQSDLLRPFVGGTCWLLTLRVQGDEILGEFVAEEVNQCRHVRR